MAFLANANTLIYLLIACCVVFLVKFGVPLAHRAARLLLCFALILMMTLGVAVVLPFVFLVDVANNVNRKRKRKESC